MRRQFATNHVKPQRYAACIDSTCWNSSLAHCGMKPQRIIKTLLGLFRITTGTSCPSARLSLGMRSSTRFATLKRSEKHIVGARVNLPRVNASGLDKPDILLGEKRGEEI